MSRLLSLSVLCLAVLAMPAWAAKKDKDDDKDDSKDDEDALLQEDQTPSEDDFKEKDEDDAAPTLRPAVEPDAKDEGKDPDDLDFTDPDEGGTLRFDENEDEQESQKPRQPGEDTAQIYRTAEAKFKEETPEEEAIAWEKYLQTYPKSIFRDRIEARMEELSALMYNERVPGSDRGATSTDAAKRELNFYTPVHLSPADTRQRMTLEAGWGYPNWINFELDYEHAFFREFSIHGGIERDLTGVALVTGAKYAVIKSARTGTLLSFALDIKGNTLPGFLGLRPAVSFGQRLRVLSGLDLNAQLAADLEMRDPFGVRWEGGLAAELHPNNVVSVFLETEINTKYPLGNVAPTFAFDTMVFGLKFTPRPGDKEGHKRFEAGFAADAPFAYSYWGFYRGGVNLLSAYYF